MTSSGLLTSWAVCGIAAGAARFVPVPLLDDVVRQRATQVAVVRTLRAHGRTGPAEPLQPLWGEREGQGSRWGRRLRAVATRVLLFPVRKYASLFGAVRGVPVDVLRVVLLARTVDRRLEQGELREHPGLPDEARALRRAVDAAVDEVDLRLLTAALADGLSQTRGLSAAAVAFARDRFGGSDPEGTGDGGPAPDGRLAEGAERVVDVLRRPEVAEVLDRFDAQVDARLAT